MTATREAVGLPLLFLLVAGIGGVRLTERALFQGPSLLSLVSATLLMAALVQSGALMPGRLMADTRGTLANANGATVLLAAFTASAQVLSLVTPESGLPALLVAVMIFAMLVQALSASVDRVRTLRMLTILLGTAFLLKFVLLAALSAPAESRIGRALQVLFDQVTLGAIGQTPTAPAQGYLAFVTLALYVFGLWLLPSAAWHTVRVEGSMLPSLSSHDLTPVRKS